MGHFALQVSLVEIAMNQLSDILRRQRCDSERLGGRSTRTVPEACVTTRHRYVVNHLLSNTVSFLLAISSEQILHLCVLRDSFLGLGRLSRNLTKVIEVQVPFPLLV